MGKIIDRFLFRGDRAERKVETLMDSGASISLMRRDIAESLSGHFLNIKPRRLRLASGQSYLDVSQIVTLEVEMKGKSLDGRFYVADALTRETIIGVDFMQTWEILLDPKRHDFVIGLDPDLGIEIALAGAQRYRSESSATQTNAARDIASR